MAFDISSSAADTSSRWVVADRRPSHEVEFEEGIVTYFVDAAELLSVPKSVAAI